MEHGNLLLEQCNFLDAEGKRWLEGSLHQLFDIVIVVGTSHWHEIDNDLLPSEDNAVKAKVFFYQKGVVVFPLAIAEFNEAANAFLTAKLRAEEKQIITFGNKGH